jgi:hypothetical protein
MLSFLRLMSSTHLEGFGGFTFTKWSPVVWVSEISGCDCEQKTFGLAGNLTHPS